MRKKKQSIKPSNRFGRQFGKAIGMMVVVLAVIVLLSVLFVPTEARTTPAVGTVEGTVLHSIQSAWEIAESENSGDTQTNALGVTERTKLIVDALIAANAATEAYISTYTLPSKWNGVRFRAIGIADGGTLTHQIYLGSLGGRTDCELTYAGQLAWVIGPQQSIYDQITFISGGTYIPKPGDVFTGADSGKTAVVVGFTLSGGAWADEDAAGTITYRSASGTFTSSELVSVVDYLGVTDPNVLVHAASDLIDFELADTLTATTKAWGIRSGTSSSWATVSPADNSTNAEAEIDIKGADYMVVVTTACSADGKLLIKGY